MRILVDLNVLLDVIRRREPHCAASAEILSRVAAGELEGAHLHSDELLAELAIVEELGDAGEPGEEGPET